MKIKFKRVHGGAWHFVDRFARCAYRYRHAPGGRDDDVGFRCCFSPFFVNDKRKDRK